MQKAEEKVVIVEEKNVIDVFVDGARKGWNIAVSSIVPNVLFAFILIQGMQVVGLISLMEKWFAPVMAIFGLPGAGIAVILSSLMSMGGGAGAAASLYASGTLDATHVTILMPSIFLMGAKIQYLGRMLGTAGVQKRFYMPLLMFSVINAVLSMLVMRFLMVFF